jgi:hypothetical protein
VITWREAVESARRYADSNTNHSEWAEAHARRAQAWVAIAREIRIAEQTAYSAAPEPTEMFAVPGRCRHGRLVTTVVPGNTPAGHTPAGSVWRHCNLSRCDDPNPDLNPD